MAAPVDEKVFIQGIDRLGYKIVGALGRIFGSLAARDEEEFKYGIGTDGYVDLAAAIGSVAQGTIRITQEADFVATRFMQQCVNSSTGAMINTASYVARVTDGGSDRDQMNVPIHVNCLCGFAQLSVPHSKNRLYRRNSTITVRFTNLTATAYRIYFAIWGYKVYDEAALDLVRKR
jgi:hypothetical protein